MLGFQPYQNRGEVDVNAAFRLEAGVFQEHASRQIMEHKGSSLAAGANLQLKGRFLSSREPLPG
jgi:hypothetical protein